MRNKQDHFDVLRKIQNNPKFSQRKLAEDLGFSLGKLNYCHKSLQEKGLVKIEKFRKNPNKINYVYVLTPKGVAEKTKLTINLWKENERIWWVKSRIKEKIVMDYNKFDKKPKF